MPGHCEPAATFVQKAVAVNARVNGAFGDRPPHACLRVIASRRGIFCAAPGLTDAEADTDADADERRPRQVLEVDGGGSV